MKQRRPDSWKPIYEAKITHWVLQHILHLDVIWSCRTGGTWMTQYKAKDGTLKYVY